MKPTTPYVGALGALLLASGVAQAANTSFSLGAEYSSGDYGTSQETHITYLPASVKYDAGSFALGATLPLVIVTGPGNVVPSGGGAMGMPGGTMGMAGGSAGGGGGGMGMPGGGATTGSQTHAGLGDIVLLGSINLSRQSARGPRTDFTTKIKLGTADRDKNLGTGENDYAFQVDVSRASRGDAVFGSLGYKIIGDPPGIDYRNTLYGTAGGTLGFRDGSSMSFFFDAQTPVLDGLAGARAFTLMYTARTGRRTRMSPYFLKGLSDASPDWAVGVSFRFIQ